MLTMQLHTYTHSFLLGPSRACFCHTDCLCCCMQGICSSPIPVGVSAYSTSDPNGASHAYSSFPRRPYTLSHTGSQAHVGSQQKGDSLPHQPGTGVSSRVRQLGVHANAGWDPNPELAGCGPLLPSWRQLSDLFVPLLHRVSCHASSLHWTMLQCK